MTLTTQIEIAAPPAEVRAVLLDFANYSTWHQGYIKSITPLKPDGKSEKGEKVKCSLAGVTFTTTILENNEQEFKWRGMLFGVPKLFVGDHSFQFKPSETTPGGTTFVQEENFSGVLSFMIKDGSKMEKQTRTNFEGYNEDLKKKCEE